MGDFERQMEMAMHLKTTHGMLIEIALASYACRAGRAVRRAPVPQLARGEINECEHGV